MKEVRDVAGNVISTRDKYKLIEDHANMLYNSCSCPTLIEAKKVAVYKFCDEQEITDMKRDMITLFDISIDEIKGYFKD